MDYLENGVTEVPPSDKIVRKQIKVQFGEEFLDYFLGLEEESGLVITLERLYNDYLVFAGYEKKDYSLKRFTKGVEESCGLLKIEYETFRDRGNSNKKCYKIYFKPKESNDLF